MAFEEAFSVEIPEDAAEKISTVKDAIDYIEQQKGWPEPTSFVGLLYTRRVVVTGTAPRPVPLASGSSMSGTA